MSFDEFRCIVLSDLRIASNGLTWSKLRDRNKLPYDRLCPEWTRALGDENGLIRKRKKGRELIWELDPTP